MQVVLVTCLRAKLGVCQPQRLCRADVSQAAAAPFARNLKTMLTVQGSVCEGDLPRQIVTLSLT